METTAELNLSLSAAQQITNVVPESETVTPRNEPVRLTTEEAPSYHKDETAALNERTKEVPISTPSVYIDQVPTPPPVAPVALVCIVCRNNLRTCTCRVGQCGTAPHVMQPSEETQSHDSTKDEIAFASSSDTDTDTMRNRKEMMPLDSGGRRATSLLISPLACVACQKDSHSSRDRPCCSKPVCSNCMANSVVRCTGDGIVITECPNSNCSRIIPYTDKEYLQVIAGSDLAAEILPDYRTGFAASRNQLSHAQLSFFWPRSTLPCIVCGGASSGACVVTPCCSEPVCRKCIKTQTDRRQSYTDTAPVPWVCPNPKCHRESNAAQVTESSDQVRVVVIPSLVPASSQNSVPTHTTPPSPPPSHLVPTRARRDTPPPPPPLSMTQPPMRVHLASGNYTSENIRSRPTGPLCIVCLDDWRHCQNRPCCAQPVCHKCMGQIIRLSINDGVAHMECPNPDCAKALTRDEVIQLIGRDIDLKNKYDRFLVDAENDGSKKTCPRCCLITEHKLPRRFRLREEDVKLRCASCDLEWCFKCHAPWHAGLTCKTFKKGDRQFHDWTKGTRVEGDANCRQCPTCRVYIQRNQGCDHMTCSRCASEFCYKCGGLYVDIPGFGDHHTKSSVFGCEYLYDGSAAERKLFRGGYLAAKIASLTGYPFLFAGGAALLLTAGVVVVPIYLGYRVYRYHKNTSRQTANRQRY